MGVLFCLPAFAGWEAPYGQSSMPKETYFAHTGAVTDAHIARAAIESNLFQDHG